MPCYDDRNTQADWEPILRHNSPTAEAFCALCKHLEKHHCSKMIEDIPAAWEWWEEHKVRDHMLALREEESKKRAEAIQKAHESLTEHQKSLLERGELGELYNSLTDYQKNLYDICVG